MRKSNGAARGEDDVLYQLVRKHVAEFRSTNGGVEPTRAQVATALERRKADVCGAMNRLEEAEAIDAARLAALPDLPERVRSAGAGLIDQIWMAANESAAVAVGELRRHIADAGHRHDRQMSATTSLLADTEAELERTSVRADTAESELANVRDQNAHLTAALDRAKAALEDREAFFALLKAHAIGSRDGMNPNLHNDEEAEEAADNADEIDAASVFGSAEKKAEDRTHRAPRKFAGPAGAGGTPVHRTAAEDEPETAMLPISGLSPPGPAAADDPGE